MRNCRLLNSPMTDASKLVKLFHILLTALSLSIVSPATASKNGGNWVCGAVSASGGGSGWGVSPSKQRARDVALAQCRSSGGGGCFIALCQFGAEVTQTEADKTKNQALKKSGPQKPERVFNNVPQRKVTRQPVRKTPQRAIPTEKFLPAPGNSPTGEVQTTSKPAEAQPEKNKKTGRVLPRQNDGCRLKTKRLPTAKVLKVNPCLAGQPKTPGVAYVPDPRRKNKGSRTIEYIRGLKGCKWLVNGVCLDADRKFPKNKPGKGGPIFLEPQ